MILHNEELQNWNTYSDVSRMTKSKLQSLQYAAHMGERPWDS